MDYDKRPTGPTLAHFIFGGALAGFALGGGGPEGFALGSVLSLLGGLVTPLFSKHDRESRELARRTTANRKALMRNGGWR